MLKMRIGRYAFALIMVAVGVLGFASGSFAPVWVGVPEGLAARNVLAWLSNAVPLVGGAGLFWQRTAPKAAQALLAYFLIGLVVLKLPVVMSHPFEEVAYQNFATTAVVVAAAWALAIDHNNAGGSRASRMVFGERSIVYARKLFGLSLLAFGLSHFIYLKMTAPLVPTWLGPQTGWAWFTGATYIAASIAILIGILDKWATALSAVQMALFVPLVWMPLWLSGTMNAFQWLELVNTCVLAVSAWVIWQSWSPSPDNGP